MSDLIGSLLNSTQALTTQTAGLQVTGRNLSNVNNTGYARQRIVTETVSGPGGQTYQRSRVESARDAVLDRSMVAEMGNSGRLDELDRLYTQLNRVMGEGVDSTMGSTLENATEDGSGVTGAISSFFNSWEALAASPNDASAKEVLFQSAQALVDTLNGANDALDTAAADLDSRLGEQSDRASELLSQIATLNQQISRQEVRQPGGATELRDARQQAIEELGGMMDFTTESGANGTVTLRLNDANATELVDGGNAATISIVRDGAGTATGLQATMGGTSTGFTPTRGTLSVLHPGTGLAEIEGFRGELDALAGQISEQVNIAYGAAGQGSFFTGTTAGTLSVGVASANSISAAAAGGAAGTNTVALAVAALASDSYTTAGGDRIDGTIGDFAALTATHRASELAAVQEQSSHQDTLEAMVRQQRDNVTGVSMDEEVTDLLRLQKAFQANARVVNVVNQMLELVTTRLGQ